MCVDGFNFDVLVRVHVVCLFIFLHFIFSCFLFFFEICVGDFSSFFHDLNVHVSFFDFFLAFFVIFIFVIFFLRVFFLLDNFL